MMTFEELRNELVGKVFTFSMLDETMQRLGFLSNMDAEFDWVEIAFGGVIFYIPKTGYKKQVMIEFYTRYENMIPEVYNDEYTIEVVITNIE